MVHACIVDAQNPVSDSNTTLPKLRKIRSSKPKEGASSIGQYRDPSFGRKKGSDSDLDHAVENGNDLNLTEALKKLKFYPPKGTWLFLNSRSAKTRPFLAMFKNALYLIVFFLSR